MTFYGSGQENIFLATWRSSNISVLSVFTVWVNRSTLADLIQITHPIEEERRTREGNDCNEEEEEEETRGKMLLPLLLVEAEYHHYLFQLLFLSLSC